MISPWLTAIVAASVAAQFVAATLALRLVPTSGRRLAWLLLAAAFFLMAVLRGATLFRALSGDVTQPPDPLTEVVALVIAVLVLVGVIWVRQMLESVRGTHQALHVEQAFLEQLIESAPEAIVVVGNDGILQRANTEFARLFGYSIEEAVGQPIDDLVAPSHLREEAQRLTDQVTGGGNVAVETVRHRRDGAVVDVSLIATPVIVEGGQVGVYGIYRDISDRKRAEEARRENEARLRLLMEQTPAVLWTTDRDLRITSWVGADVSGSNLQPDQIVGQTLLEYFQTAKPNVIPVAMHRRALEGEQGSYEIDGASNIYQALVQPLHGEHETIVGCIGVALDITVRRALEAQLRQAQKMEAVGQLTGGIAHDFNNLLTVILANAELVKRALPADLAGARSDLEEVLSAGRRGRALVKKLLGFGRRSPLELQELDLGDILGELSHVLSRVLPEHLEIRLSATRGLGAVQADAGAIEQILLNLVTNARDAMPGGGVLEVGLERCRLDAQFVATHPGSAPGEYVCLSVRDSGEGMDERTLEHVFEPFFTTKPPGEGTGLGLAMIYGLVKQHRGFVDVTSAPGAGTIVDVYLPVTRDRAPERRARVTRPSVKGGAEHILVVDDEESVLRAAKRTLEGCGYVVSVAANGEQALDVVRRSGKAIDLVITDLVMPRMGGVELRGILDRDGWKGKVLLTSGYVGHDAHGLTIEPGLPFLHKPWTPAELLRWVRGLLDADPGLAAGELAADAHPGSSVETGDEVRD